MDSEIKFSPQSAGGKIMAIRQRQEAVDKYYENPNSCGYCEKIIEIKPNQKVAAVRLKRFCNQSCNSSYHSKPKIKPRFCNECNIEIFNKDKRSKYCDMCRETLRINNIPKTSLLMNMTKGELFKTRKNWQCARGAIVKISRNIYTTSDLPKLCAICKYSKHFDVCHLKAVASYPDDAKIGEINNLNNLIALCRNHHWEYDNGDEETIKLVTELVIMRGIIDWIGFSPPLK